jgi:hypothetical protein
LTEQPIILLTEQPIKLYKHTTTIVCLFKFV